MRPVCACSHELSCHPPDDDGPGPCTEEGCRCHRFELPDETAFALRVTEN